MFRQATIVLTIRHACTLFSTGLWEIGSWLGYVHATQTGLNLLGSSNNNDVLINGAIVYHAVATSIELSSIQVVVWRAAWAFSLVLVLAVASICDLAQTTLTLSLVSPHVLTCTIPVLSSIAMTSLLMHCPHT